MCVCVCDNEIRPLFSTSSPPVSTPPPHPPHRHSSTPPPQVYAIANVQTTADPVCQRYFASAAWKCIFGEYALPLVRSPYLLHAYLYDEYQIAYDLGIPFAARPSTQEQLDFAERFRNHTTEAALK